MLRAIAAPYQAYECVLVLRSISSTAGAMAGLNIALITGASRTEGPPEPILAPRVAQFIKRGLERRNISVNILDPRELELPLLQKPEFAYPRSQVPATLAHIKDVLSAADAYVTVTPEYNHAPSPALVNLLNHFGSSTFSFKPSAIVSYSAGALPIHSALLHTACAAVQHHSASVLLVCARCCALQIDAGVV